MKSTDWSKYSWRSYHANQQPGWPEAVIVENTLKKLCILPALVFAGETRALRQQLDNAIKGKTFVLQCGDCSEDFSGCNGVRIHNLVKVILQMSIILTYAGEKQVVNIGRIAGQYAKPRSFEKEIVSGCEIPIYRGDMINNLEATPEARKSDPRKMLEGYFQAAATLNLVRAFMSGGYASLKHAQAWHRDFCDKFPSNLKYEELVRGIRKAINFMSAMSLDTNSSQLNQNNLYTSHEALLLDYEECMTRIDTTTGDWYDTSAHMLWIGDRTRQSDGAHVEFLRGVHNPIGIKIGPKYDIDDIKRVIEKINPKNQPGRLTFITRFGSDKIELFLPALLREIKNEGFKIVWICDPMHGNTYKSELSKKTRNFEDILKEMQTFCHIHKAEGTVASGVHLELTGDNVTECVGGSRHLLAKDLIENYQTNCDPRLNAEQAVEFAFEIAELLNP